MENDINSNINENTESENITAPEAPEATPEVTPETAIITDTQPEAKPKKKHKALKVIVIILAVFLALILILAVVLFAVVSKLTGISPTSGTAEYSSDEFSEIMSEDYVSPFSSDVFTTEQTSDISSDETASSGDETATVYEETASVTQAVTNSYTEGTTSSQQGTTSVTQKQETATAAAKQETTTAAKQQETTTKKQETATKKQETTTKKQETTTKKQETTTAAAKQTKSEYDIYRSGNFYALGWVTDSSGVTPLELAVTSDTLYMLSSFEGTDIGVLIMGDETYMIYPEKKAYMEINSLLMSMMGEDGDNLFSLDELGLSELQPLSAATSVYEATVNGVACKKYVLKDDDGFSYVYMNGTELMRIEQVDTSNTVVSTIDFTSVSETVPQNKRAIPSGYDKKGMLEFMSLLTDLVE